MVGVEGLPTQTVRVFRPAFVRLVIAAVGGALGEVGRLSGLQTLEQVIEFGIVFRLDARMGKARLAAHFLDHEVDARVVERPGGGARSSRDCLQVLECFQYCASGGHDEAGLELQGSGIAGST